MSSSIEAVESELQALRAEVERLRSELESARHKPGTSMRSHNLCPMCGGRSFLHLAEIRDHQQGGHEAMTVQLMGILRLQPKGVFEVYACRGCEYLEWYLKGAADIDPAELDKKNRKIARIIDGEPPTGGVFR